MSARWLLAPGVLLAVVLALSCESNEAPVATDGEIVLRFDPAPAPVVPALRASVFDSVVVNVYRSGSPLRLEVSRGAAITNDSPATLQMGCIAENGKKIAVDLYVNRVLAYHGSNPDVDVAANKTTAVTIDVSAFYVSDLTLTPQVIPDGAAFTLRWPPAPAAASYRVEESATLDFAVIASSQTVADTTLDVHVGTGSHYFRVRPVTPYALGPASVPRLGYVTSGSNQLKITGVDAAVIPGETITITGENLDFPGTQAVIGAHALAIESLAWGQIVARAPRDAVTGKVTVSSGVGSDTSNQDVVVERVAYVTTAPASTSTADYLALLASYSADFANSGIAVIPVADLDWREMSAFDIIVVAADTGTLKVNWGGGQPARAGAIAASDANVLAIGKGGSIFLDLVAPGASVTSTVAADADRKYFEPDTGAQIFNTPHTVGGPDLTYASVVANTVALAISSPYPAGVSLYASTDKNCLVLCSPNDQWALADFRFDNPQSVPVVYFFWGYAGSATDLTSAGKDCLGNVMYMLYRDP